MEFTDEMRRYGVIKINENGSVEVYRDLYNSSNLQCVPAQSATWVGNGTNILVTSRDGKQMLYRNFEDYSYV